MTIQIAYPDELLRIAELTEDQFSQLAHEALVVRLYALGAVSTGKGAELLGVTRREFLVLLGRYNVSEFEDDLDLEAELERG